MRPHLLSFVVVLSLLAVSGRPRLIAAEPQTGIGKSFDFDDATRQHCVQILREGLLSAEFWPSMHAAEGLTLAGHGSEVIAFLRPRLEFVKDDQHRCGVARELVRSGERDHAQVMLDILTSADDHGHVHAAESLYKVGELGDGVALRRAFDQDDNKRLKLMSAAALAKVGNTQALSYMREMLGHQDAELARTAAWIIGRVGDATDIERLRQHMAQAPDEFSRAYFEHALAALGDAKGLKALTRNLKSANPAVRTYACEFVPDAQATGVAPQLAGLLDDENLDVRVRAAHALLVLFQPVLKAEETTVLPPSRQVVYEALARKAQAALDRRREAFEQLKTPEQFTAWQSERREFFWKAIGGQPERTPLNAEVVGRLDSDGYRVEKIIYESRPRHHVTATLYLPDTNARPPFPAVLIACGHTKTGKAAEYNQRIGILLAKNGIAAMCYDPIGQGERSQILDDNGQPAYKGSTTEHFLAGVGSTLAGGSAAQFRIWDGIRGIDYLTSREDIDAKRIGCTGCSGGGTLTSYIMALDDRVACAAPACYLTTFERLVETLGPQDAEQNIFGQIAFGMDHADYILMRAPRPTLICATTDDFFDIEGTWDTFRQAKRFYTRLGFPERVELVEDAGRHGVTQRGREALVRWMRRWLLSVDDAITDPGFPVWPEEVLRCTPDGEVLQLDGERSVFDLSTERAQTFRKAREEFAELPPDKAREVVRQVAGIRRLKDLPRPQVRVVGEVPRPDYRLRKLVFEAADGIPLPALRFTPREPNGTVTLYLHGGGKHVDAQPGGAIEKLVRSGQEVLAVDVRGVGETLGQGASEQLGDWKNYYLSYLLGQSYVGSRAEDVLIVARWLRETTAADRVAVVAIGETAISALHAAGVEPQLCGPLEARETVDSWLDVVKKSDPSGQLTNAVHAALEHYDLPDLRRLASEGR